MKWNAKTRFGLAISILLSAAALLVAQAQHQHNATTKPAETEKPSMDRMMAQCMEHCQATQRSIDETLRAIETAREGNDMQAMRAALDKAHTQLTQMKEHMSKCMEKMKTMQKMHGGMMREHLAANAQWTCPMHPQVKRDKPGNCPICGMPLAKGKTGHVATRPSHSDEHGAAKR